METKRWNALAGLIAVALAGCGGGGGGGPAPVGNLAITATNQDTVARSGMVALQAAVLGGSAGVTAGGSATLARSAGRAAALAQRKRIAAVQPPDSQACDVSGRIVTVFDDRDNSGTANAGDVATITYENCSDVAGEVSNGTIVATYSQVQLGATIVIGASMTGGMTTQTSTATVVTQGGFTMLLRVDATSGSLRITVPSSLALGITTGLYSDTVTLLSGYALDSVYDSNALPPSGTVPGRTTTTASGLVESGAAAGNVQLSTPQPFVQYDVDAYPRSGQFVAAGRTGVLRATVQSVAQVLVELDADGNGSFEASKTVAWSDFF